MDRTRTSDVLPGPKGMTDIPAIVNILKSSVIAQFLLTAERLRIDILT